jgi:hypothetical protein
MTGEDGEGGTPAEIQAVIKETIEELEDVLKVLSPGK